jgi:DNA-binding transcriptional MerR regulator
LTLAEVIHLSNFDDIEARRLIKRFGKFLGPGNFGDMVKYPQEAVETLIRIGELSRQGCTTQEITAILSHNDRHSEESFLNQLQREVGTLLKLQDEACKLLRSTSDMVQQLMSEVAVLTEKLAAAEAEIQNLKEANQKYGLRLRTESWRN